MSQCPFYSRAYGVRCELREGHASTCNHDGHTFLGGVDDTWWDANSVCLNCDEPKKQHAGEQCLFAPTTFLANTLSNATVILNGKKVVR